MPLTGVCAVLDLGKSHIKVSLVNMEGKLLENTTTSTPSLSTADYTALDVDRIFDWLCKKLGDYAQQYQVSHIIPVAHGAAAALVDESGELVMPVMDYEAAIPDGIYDEYESMRPVFAETCSPKLPTGLNLGRQLYWQSRLDQERFRHVRWILPYPQYWAYRLSGTLASEISSLGCHTDLWQPAINQASSLCISQGWLNRLPTLRSAWEEIGRIKAEIAERTGLSADCAVHTGVHDTNAALYYLIAVNNTSGEDTSPVIISTGTWFVTMAPGESTSDLDERRDCLANVDVFGKPVPCARFMGGREYSIISSAVPASDYNLEDILRIIDNRILALPAFVDTGGPFCGDVGEILGLGNGQDYLRPVLASLYLALVADLTLDLIHANSRIIIEGPATSNEIFTRALATLRDSKVAICREEKGATLGGAALAFKMAGGLPFPELESVDAIEDDALKRYRSLWQETIRDRIAL